MLTMSIKEKSKFKQLGILLYGGAQGPIVSSNDFDKDQEFFSVGGLSRHLKV